MQEEIKDHIWRELPLVRRNLVGRDRVNDLIEMAIEQAPLELFRHVAGNKTSQKIVLAAWGANVKRGYCLVRESTDEKQFGPIFWILIGPLLQTMLQKFMDWYFRSPQNAARAKELKRRAAGDG